MPQTRNNILTLKHINTFDPFFRITPDNGDVYGLQRHPTVLVFYPSLWPVLHSISLLFDLEFSCLILGVDREWRGFGLLYPLDVFFKCDRQCLDVTSWFLIFCTVLCSFTFMLSTIIASLSPCFSVHCLSFVHRFTVTFRIVWLVMEFTLTWFLLTFFFCLFLNSSYTPSFIFSDCLHIDLRVFFSSLSFRTLILIFFMNLELI